MKAATYKKLIDCAAGRIPADTVLTNCRVVCVFTGATSHQNVAIIDGHIAGIGHYEGRQSLDLEGRFVSPGFIDGHIHIESSMLTPSQFAAAVLPHGTTAVICDPHEIANVCGIPGIEFMLSGETPLSIFAMAPSCVPATHMETNGATLTAEDIATLLQRDDILGLAEMMNFPGTVAALPEINDKILRARGQDMLIDGHAPGLSGKDLQAYIAAGISSDHECTTLAEAEEKIRLGMSIFIREGSTARNLAALMPLITSPSARRCLLVSDDRHADDLIEQGHLDHILRKAVRLGADPLTALQLVTINPAQHFGLQRTGAVAPGYHADLVVLDDLEQFKVNRVFCRGKCVAANGIIRPKPARLRQESLDPLIRSSVNINPDTVDLTLRAASGPVRVINCRDGEIVTSMGFEEPTLQQGMLVADPERDLLKIAVIERHRGTQSTGLGFVHGLGIKNGAIASTVAHDSHNLIVVGTSDQAMLQAITAVVAMQGGLAVAGDDRVHATLPLPVAGLMASCEANEVSAGLHRLKSALEIIGTGVENPFMLLSFLALPVIPELKITDKGLVDVNKFQLVSLQAKKINKNQ